MRKASKAQPPSYWVQLLYEQVERVRAERDMAEERQVEAADTD
jgi:hypothetical protein